MNEDLPYIGQNLFNALGKLQKGAELTNSENRLMDAKQKATDAFATADVLVFAFPLWNLTIPAVLHTFIDYVFAAGFTFKYNADGSMDQLMKDKKVVLLNARGGGSILFQRQRDWRCLSTICATYSLVSSVWKL